MSVAIITGSAGLIGSEATKLFSDKGLEIIGIDNDMRSHFFGPSASTAWNRERLEREVRAYQHEDVDIRDDASIDKIFSRYGTDIVSVVHTAAQPSHDWAAREPVTDFTVNANGTLVLLEATRKHCADASFIFTSTNKVYGDTPNGLPLVELEDRWELQPDHPYAEHGIDESMSIDNSMHSLFGASKAGADLIVQEYGRYFGIKTGCFRGGCLTGSAHSGAMLHGFLAYLMRCAVDGSPYTVFGYNGKQVRDNIHSRDFANALWHFSENPRPGEFYNMGGSRHSNCSMLEAIKMCEQFTGRPMNWSYSDDNRAGDHIWWISDVRKFQDHFPGWSYEFDMDAIMADLHGALVERLEA